jgi:hypothetical protein
LCWRSGCGLQTYFLARRVGGLITILCRIVRIEIGPDLSLPDKIDIERGQTDHDDANYGFPQYSELKIKPPQSRQRNGYQPGQTRNHTT